jgi:hypothetical protein
MPNKSIAIIEIKTMNQFFVLTVLLSFLGKAFSKEIAPVVATLYSGPVSPVGIWSDANGNIYGCETSFHSVFKITSGGVKTDFAGTRGTAGVASEGVLALNALFNSPRAVWGDGQFLYVTDSVNNRIRRVSWTTSLITTVVGGGTGSILTSGSFPGTSVALTLPNAIAGSSNGKIYFADFDHVYVLDTETGLVGMVSFIAGGGDRIGTFAHGAQVSLKDIQGLAVDPTNNNILFVADAGNKVVRKMDLATGSAIIFAGRAKKDNFLLPSKPFENGEAAYKVKLGYPSSVWVDNDGKVFIADSLFHTISVVRHDMIFLFAGKWSSGAISNTLMTGPANQVEIEASHIFGDSSKGVLYLSDGTRGGIQQISPLNVNVYAPTAAPTVKPTNSPTASPTLKPSDQPTSQPTRQPSGQPTSKPTHEPSWLYNGDAETGLLSEWASTNALNTGWKVTSGNAHSGTYKLQTSCSSSCTALTQTNTKALISGKYYKLKFNAYYEDGTAVHSLKVSAGAITLFASLPLTTSWKRYEITFYAYDTSMEFKFDGLTDGVSSILVDDISLVPATPGPFVPTTAAAVVPEILATSLDNLEVSKADLGGLYVGFDATVIYPAAFYLLSTASYTSTSHTYIVGAFDDGYTKMVSITISIIGGKVYSQAGPVKYTDDDQTGSATLLNNAWASGWGGDFTATCVTCDGYGVTNLAFRSVAQRRLEIIPSLHLRGSV